MSIYPAATSERLPVIKRLPFVISSSMQPRCAAVPVTRHGVRGKGPRAPPSLSPHHRSLRRRAAARRSPRLGRPRARTAPASSSSPRRAAPPTTSRARWRVARGGAIGLHRFSVAQLAARLAAPVLAARGIAPVSFIGGEAVAARATFEASRDEGLEYFGPVARHARLPARARAHAARVDARPGRRGRAGSLPLGGSGPRPPARTVRGAVRGGVRDRSRRRCSRPRRKRPAPIATFPLLLLDVPMDSAVEFDFVAKLIEAAPDVLVTDSVRRPRDARSVQDGRASTRRCSSRPATSDLTALKRYVFATRQPPERDALGRRPALLGAGRRARVRRDRPADPGRRRAPACRSTRWRCSCDRRAITSACSATRSSRAGIPAWFDRGTGRPHPSGRAFLALLGCAVERLSAARFAEYLSLSQVPDAGSARRPRRHPATCRRSVLRFHRRSRRRRTNPTTARCDDRSSTRPAASGADREHGAGRRRHAARAVEVGEADRRVRGHRRRPAAVAPPARRARGAVSAAVGRRGARGSRLAAAPADRARRAQPGAPARLRAAGDRRARVVAGDGDLGRLARALRGARAARAAQAGARPAGARRAEADGRHRSGLARGSARRPRATGCARSTSTRRRTATARSSSAARTRRAAASFRVVFVPGLAERMFPQKPREDPMLLDKEMREPLDAGLPIAGRPRARPSGCSCGWPIGAATERLWLSYPRIDVAGARPRVPSFYVLDIMRAITGHIPNHEALQRQALVEGGAKLDWPAPARPADAIDDVEHDLATLRELIDAPDPAAVKGHAHYLLRLNDALRRSVTTRWARARSRWMPQDGLVRVAPATKADARLAAARGAAVLAVGAAEVRDLPVPVPPVGDLSPRAERRAGAAAAARSADARRAVPRGPGGVLPFACRRKGWLPLDAARRAVGAPARRSEARRGGRGLSRAARAGHRPRLAGGDRRPRARPARVGPEAAGRRRAGGPPTSSSASGCRTKAAIREASASR